MKRILLLCMAAVLSTALCSAAMSNSKVRKETRFLTDKMAYELNLNTDQYNDVYEINYDFISGIRYVMDDVLDGEEWAMNRYYESLDVRNDDLRFVLSARQYTRLMGKDYFFRPVYVSGRNWNFRVYITYSNRDHFYFPVPRHYRTYCGGHYRTHYNNVSYYRGRHNHSPYEGNYRIRDDKSYTTSRRSDFGAVNVRPNTGNRPAGRGDDVYSRRSNGNDNGSSRRSNSNSRTNNVDTNRSNENSGNSRRSTRSSSENKEKKESTEVRSSENSRRSNSSSSRSNSSRSNSSSRTPEKGRR